ncbi:glycosyl transferase [candidate division WWE3 bacterium CG10_big_fil_rev_8_21_14_0_10_32_10]|uniref:Glycosyl transferase n=1 Tax=candidate division WWE3 bacterium CG10_big_fil_rev_8_21_14_0_10_32_10 TaxID=1975090 RepID=A0A2H0RBX9_UNCKA|nr:MAG: glycosyl transferase [candidate division WWE3 bacterium CG10_big_fil_rev_8_21_14_0_10_32_10]
MKVAIVHDYLNDYGGAEKVVNAIHELYPKAPIYTAVKNEGKLHKAGAFLNAKIIAPKINGIIGPLKKLFIFSYPIYFENINLQKYDLVISSTAHFAKGVVVNPHALHICYIHTPPRFLWGYKTETSIRDKWWAKIPLKFFDSFLRVWDYNAAQRPDFLLTNSKNTKERIKKFYKRDSTVIYPFYNFLLKDSEIKKIKPKKGDFYFTISRKGKYKNLNVIAEAFKNLKQTIYIAGSGSTDPDLKKYEGANVKLLGFVDEKTKISYLKGCKAFILATENEDFGITPLEAMHFGKPVIALNSGGLRETVIPNKTGLLYDSPTVGLLVECVLKFENPKTKFQPNKIKQFADEFSKERFQKEFSEFVDSKMKVINFNYHHSE